MFGLPNSFNANDFSGFGVDNTQMPSNLVGGGSGIDFGMNGTENLFNGTTSSPGGFSLDGFDLGGSLQGLGSIVGGIGGIMGIGLAQDQLDMAEDQFGFQKDFANRNIANQAKLLNNKIIGDEQRYLQDLRGDDDDTASYNRLQAEGKQKAQEKTVDGSAIG